MENQISLSSYIPSVVEKKRAITCFLFIGILMSLVSQKEFSVYEHYYLSVSIAWWSVGVFVLLFSLISIIITPFLLLSVPLLFFWFVIGVVFVVQAWNNQTSLHPFFSFFQGLGSRLLALFEVK